MSDNSPTSPLDICNLALTELKISPLQSLDQINNEVASLCRRHYDIVRKGLLRSHTWNFAKTEKTLNKSANGVSTSYTDVYELPSDYLRLYSVGDVLVGTKDDFYDIRTLRIDGNYVRCITIDNNGSSTLDIIIIRNVTDVREFDPLFINLLKYEIANAIASGVSLKPSTKQEMKISLNDARLLARSIDGQERPPVRVSKSKFLQARKFGIVSNPIRTTFS